MFGRGWVELVGESYGCHSTGKRLTTRAFILRRGAEVQESRSWTLLDTCLLRYGNSAFPLAHQHASLSQFLHPRLPVKQWQPTPVLLPGKSHGRRSLVGYSPWGLEEPDTTEWLNFHFYALEKEMAAHSSILAWRIPGTEEPGGLSSMGSHRVRHDWCDLAAAAAPSGLWLLFIRCLRHLTCIHLYFFWVVYYLLSDLSAHSSTVSNFLPPRILLNWVVM